VLGPARLRLGSLLGVFVMVAATVAIVAVAGQVMATALGAPGAGRFASADIVVRADPTVHVGHGHKADRVDVQRPVLLSPGAPDRVAAVPGVQSAVGDVAFPVAVIGRDGAPVPTRGHASAHGHGWPSAALTPYRLLRGRTPVASSEVVLDQDLARSGSLAVGDEVRVVTPGGGTGAFRLVGIVSASRAQQARRSSVFFTQPRAEQLSGLGSGFNAVAVRVRPGGDSAELEARIGAAAGDHAQVLDSRHASAGDAGDSRAFDRVQLVSVVASGGGLTVAITIFIVAGTIGFAVDQRRREIALLRVIGATPGQARRMLTRQTVPLGLLAGVGGCAAARLLYGPATAALRSGGLAPDGFTVAPNPIPYVIAVAAGALVSLLGTLIASRRALAGSPGEALVLSALPARRLAAVRVLAGLAALGGGVTLIVVLSSSALSYATLTAFLLMAAVTLLAPVVVGWPSALAGRALLPGGGAGFLAGSALVTARFRTGAVGAAIALVVALAGAQVLDVATARRATERAAASRVVADHVVVARAGDGLPPSVARSLAKVPGASVSGVVSTSVYLLDRGLTRHGSGWDAAGVDPTSMSNTVDVDLRAGSLADVRGHAVAVSETVARAGDLSIGSVLQARLADGTKAQLHVAAVYADSNGFGDVLLPHALALSHATAPLDSAVFVSGGDGTTVSDALKQLAAKTPSALTLSRAAYLGRVKAQAQENVRAQWVIVALMIAVAVMGAFNTGAMAAAERRGELLLARLNGATKSQIAGALTLEAAAMSLVAIVIGMTVALAALVHADDDPTGGPLAVPWSQLGLVLAGGAALGLVGMLIPAALVGRIRLPAVARLHE
jgi:putative ABC transport system permease protein